MALGGGGVTELESEVPSRLPLPLLCRRKSRHRVKAARGDFTGWGVGVLVRGTGSALQCLIFSDMYKSL